MCTKYGVIKAIWDPHVIASVLVMRSIYCMISDEKGSLFKFYYEHHPMCFWKFLNLMRQR